MSDLARRVRVVLGALPTWLAAVALAAPVLAQQVAVVFPHGAERLVADITTAGGVAAAAVTVIRRLKPAEGHEIGLLPPAAPVDNGPEGPVPGRLAGS